MNYFKSPLLLKGGCSFLLLAITAFVQVNADNNPDNNPEARNRVVGEIVWMASDYCDETMVIANGSSYRLPTPPTLAGAIPIGAGQGASLAKYTLGDSGGNIRHIAAPENTPPHSHSLSAVTASMQASKAAGNRKQAEGHYFAQAGGKVYAKPSLTPTGGVMAVVSGTSASNPTSDPMAITGQTPFLALTPCMVVGQGQWGE